MGGWADSWRSRPQRQRVRLVPPGTSCCPPRLSFSRCAHCSACAYYQLRLLLGGPNDMARTGSVCARPRCSRCVPSRSTPSPTPVIAFCCLREITRHLHRGCAKCGEPPSLLVSGLSTGVLHVGNRGTTGSLRPQSRTVARLSTVVHRTRPRVWGQRRDVTASSSPEPSTGHPHSSTGRGRGNDCAYLSTSISPGLVHICVERRSRLSTIGDNSWVRPVDNVGMRSF